MEYKFGFELIGVASLLSAAVASTINYYLGAAYSATIIPLVTGLTAVYPISTFSVKNEKLAFYALFLFLVALLLVFTLPVLVVLAVVPLLVMMVLVDGRRSVAPLFCLTSLSLLQDDLVTVVVQVVAALAGFIIISPKILSHRSLLPIGFIVAAFLTVTGYRISGLTASLASVSVFVLYHSGNYERCPFRIERRLASLGLLLITATSLSVIPLEVLGLFVSFSPILMLVLTVSLYVFYTGLIAPRS
jgi:hypothetical protein